MRISRRLRDQRYKGMALRLKKKRGYVGRVSSFTVNGMNLGSGELYLLVCGLHVPWNLRVITHRENTAKGNKWWPDMPFEQLSLIDDEVAK